MVGSDETSDILKKYRVGELKTLIYIPKFISDAEETALLENSRHCKGSWKEVSSLHFRRRPCKVVRPRLKSI